MQEKGLTAFEVGVSAVMSIFVEVNFKVALILVMLMILDIIIGTLFSIINGEFESKQFKKGLIIKILIFLLALSLLLILDVLKDAGMEIPFASTFGILLCFNEFMSILESFARNDVVLPQPIVRWFRQVNEQINNKDEEDI